MKTAQPAVLRVHPAWRAARILAGSVAAMAAGAIGPFSIASFWSTVFRKVAAGNTLSTLALSLVMLIGSLLCASFAWRMWFQDGMIGSRKPMSAFWLTVMGMTLITFYMWVRAVPGTLPDAVCVAIFGLALVALAGAGLQSDTARKVRR